MRNVFAFANQKGGVAKTTTVSTLAAGLTRQGFRVLAIDCDPQGDLSASIGANNETAPTLYEVMNGSVEAQNAIQNLEPFDIIPANILLAGMEQDANIGRENRLREAIRERDNVTDKYDYILIDCPPSLGVLTINAFTAADYVTIPTMPGAFEAMGIQQLYETLKRIKKYTNPDVSVDGVLITMYNSRSNINKDMKELTEKLAEYIDSYLYKTTIRSGVAIKDAQADKMDIFTYRTINKKRKCSVADDYEAFVKEFIERERGN